LLVNHRQGGRVAFNDRGQVAGVGGDVDERAEQLLRGGVAGVEAVEQPGVAGEGLRDQAAEDRGLGREVVVQRRGRGAELTGDVGDRRARVALTGEQLAGDGEDPLLGVGLGHGR